MAEAAVVFLLENLKQLLIYHVQLISDVRQHAESLMANLNQLKGFLKDVSRSRIQDHVLKNFVREIRTLTYQAEDSIDSYVALAAAEREKSGVDKILQKIAKPIKLTDAAKDIESITKRMKDVYAKLDNIEALRKLADVPNTAPQRREAPVVEEVNVVGFDNEAKTVIGRLTGPSERLEVISIIGMAGLGKTTLARKVFTDPTIEFEFYARVWVYVSQECSRSEVFLTILRGINPATDATSDMSENDLANKLKTCLQKERYLIVMDDVWTKKDWVSLQIAFPNNDNGSRILLTSRQSEVAACANPDGAHNLRFLTDDESWELLEKKVFGTKGCPEDLNDMKKLGKSIAKKCYGLPLAIVVIAGFLSVNKEPNDLWLWKNVVAHVSTYIAKEPEQCMDVLAWSYNHLPYQLKPCFLYFGVFPEDFEIPIWILIRLWIAEGFVEQVDDISLEDTAEEYLQDFVNRNLVLVAKRRTDGRIKTCRIHDLLRDLCVKEAAEENVFKQIKLLSSSTSNFNTYRRLCISYSRVLEYIYSKPSGPHVRSFLCFARDESVILPREQVSVIPGAFKLLRVLDVRTLTFTQFPRDLRQLVLLRYIAISCNFKKLPTAISNLWNLQTLIVQTSERILHIEADIWKMLQLRHIHTNASTHLHGPTAVTRKKNEDPLVSGNLQTLSTISPESCTEKVLSRTPNLKKLGIRGKLMTLLEDKSGSSLFDSLAKLQQVETLKLFNDMLLYRSTSEGKLYNIPQDYKFPKKLKKLTVSNTMLDWEHMSTLGKLPYLEVLKLKERAFEGKSWEPQDGGFCSLKVLQIIRTDLVYWRASAHHFPKLELLVLRHCGDLNEVPSSLADVSRLQKMELHWPSKSAASSAKKIEEQKLKMQQERGSGLCGFKVHIYPPDLLSQLEQAPTMRA